MKTITKEQEDFLNKCTWGTWRLNTESGLVDIDGDFNCSNKGLSDFLGIEFGKVTNNFYCYDNKLVSLKGAPREVGKDFDCYGNQLISLEGAPKEIGRVFCCDPLPIKFFDLDLFTKTLFYLDKEFIDPKLRVMDISGGLAPEIYLKKMV